LELPNINGDLETGSGISCGKYIKPAESTPISILVLMELIGDILPGVVNIVNGFGAELGRALVTKKSIKSCIYRFDTYRSFSDAICN
jgi:delta 1-pyrroline-5-carboxylate dehydrogenase